MKKFLSISALLLLLFTTTFINQAVASAKSSKDGINQAGGCNNYVWNYKFKDSSNHDQSGTLKVGLCINEHYSQEFQNYIIQSDMYVSHTGAPISCDIYPFNLQIPGDTSIYGKPRDDYGSPANYPNVYCPSKKNFSFHRFGKYIIRAKLSDSRYQTVGYKFFGTTWITAQTLDLSGPSNSSLGVNLKSPSLMMK